MKYIFGPVNSRRLGRSLGVDLFTDKICNLNCIYCEVGPTVRLTCDRGAYTPTDEILLELERFFSRPGYKKDIDTVTITASGEPTLHAGLGRILSFLRNQVDTRIALLTNGTTLDDETVRREVSLADVVIPSLDAALPESFRRLDRPARCLDLEKVIEGLVTFSRQFAGQLWLEILFAEGINDDDRDLQALAEVIARMRLDRIQINTVARPPLESFARPLTKARLQEIGHFFQTRFADIPVDLLAQGAPTVDVAGDRQRAEPVSERITEIIEMLRRRPCTAADINKTFHLGGSEKVEQSLEPLVRSGQLRLRQYGDRKYYQIQ